MKQGRFSPEVHERAVRLVFESRVEGQSMWSTIESVAAKIGCAPQTLNEWVKQHQRDAGQREGPTTDDKKRMAELERENRELRKANEILKLASVFLPRRNSTAD